jgi:hypothetical protein
MCLPESLLDSKPLKMMWIRTVADLIDVRKKNKNNFM